ncbi:hypothetical protein ACIQVL_05605 [Streptomyces sp. NPDC090499]|uniref:hypothetical protein n=1 Tax=Streptomyces sp. NPDC090499 TaxID=3365965 RepID=UPI0037FBDFA1
MSAILMPVAARIAAALTAAHGSSKHEKAVRLMQVTEEAGEASAAYILLTSTTHTTTRDVADELCDVIIAAAVALHSFTDTPAADLTAKLDAVARRLNATTPERTA